MIAHADSLKITLIYKISNKEYSFIYIRSIQYILKLRLKKANKIKLERFC